MGVYLVCEINSHTNQIEVIEKCYFKDSAIDLIKPGDGRFIIEAVEK